jgi:hypothetical protein
MKYRLWADCRKEAFARAARMHPHLRAPSCRCEACHLARLEVRAPESVSFRAAYHRARAEHATALRAEGLPFLEIGKRLGVTRERARQMQQPRRKPPTTPRAITAGPSPAKQSSLCGPHSGVSTPVSASLGTCPGAA